MLGKLSFTTSLPQLLAEQEAKGLRLLPIALNHIWELANLPPAHKDPFDRMLIAQAIVEGSTLVSADAIFQQYPVTILW